MQLLSASTSDETKFAQVAQAYRNSSFSAVQVQDFLNEDIAGAVSAFLLEEARFTQVYGVHSVPGHATDVATWTATPERDRLFHNEMLDGTGGLPTSRNLLSFLRLRKYFSSEQFCEMVSECTQLELPSAFEPRVHSLRQRHYLRAHHDRAGSRRIAYILYLSPGWQPDFGGQLTMLAADGEKMTVTPRYNSLLLFDVYAQEEHYIEPVLPLAGERQRLTMSAWLNCERNP